MKKYIFLSPYLLLFYDGVFCIIISILLVLLEYFIVPELPEAESEKVHKFKFFEENFVEIITIFKEQPAKFYLLFFLSMILTFLYYISNIHILYHYSPFFNILFELIFPIDSDILDHIIFNSHNDHAKEEIFERFGYQMIGYVILFFGALILNEIIVLNFFGFNKNIAERYTNDSAALLNINNENDTGSKSQLSYSQDYEE